MTKKETKGEEMNLTEIQTKSNAMQKMVDEVKVTNDDELKFVADRIKEVKILGKFIKQEKEKYTKPAQQIITEARRKYLPFENLCKDAENQLKNKAGKYMEEVEEKRRKKEESIAKRVEKGTMKEETAVGKMEEIGEEQKSVSTGNSQLQHRTVKFVEIVDEKLIPKEYWIVDEAKVKKAALAGVEIPGVEVKEKSQVVSI